VKWAPGSGRGPPAPALLIDPHGNSKSAKNPAGMLQWSIVTRVKICGITNRDDARATIELGADALGFNFVRDTPRYVGDVPNLIELLDSIPPFVSRVGVCIRPDDVASELLDHLDLIQTYDHSYNYRHSAGTRLMPAFRLRTATDLDLMEPVLADYSPQAVLLDAYHEDVLGGSGVTFDWGLAVEAQARFGVRVVLAGGLTPENVAEAIRQVKPYAVDVSSGVESSTPGRKDHARLEAFIRSARGLYDR
jgi:phosphoribosylanthranilate isomerase